MTDRLRTLVYSSLLVVICGWLLVVGKSILIPVVTGGAVVFVIVGLTQALRRVALGGHVLPLLLRALLAVLCIGCLAFSIVYLAMTYWGRMLALTPQYQQSLLLAIQQLAVLFGIENEPTWGTIRQELLAQINIQRLLGSMVSSVTSIFISIVVVLLYATFLLVELQNFPSKIDQLGASAANTARLRLIGARINSRIGAYLGLKAVLSLLLGVLSWGIMAWFGLEFALFWAILITLLNFIPYIGSFLGVLLPFAMAIAQFQDSAIILPLMLGLIAVQFLIGNFLDPYMMGSSLNLSPLAILLSLALWSALWGISGAFLAVPITAAIAIVCSEFASTRPIAVMLSQNGRL